MRKSDTFYNWRRYGLIGNYDKIYDIYLNTTNCDKCNVILEGNGNNRKCMDHNHKTGEFRNILCHKCNCQDKPLNQFQKNNKSGYPNIHYDKNRNKWVYSKMFNKKKYFKRFKTLKDALCYKFYMLLKLNKE